MWYVYILILLYIVFRTDYCPGKGIYLLVTGTRLTKREVMSVLQKLGVFLSQTGEWALLWSDSIMVQMNPFVSSREMKTSTLEAFRPVLHQVWTFTVYVVMTPSTKRWKRPCVCCWKDETEVTINDAVVKEKTMPRKADLKTASSVQEPSIRGPWGVYLSVS